MVTDQLAERKQQSEKQQIANFHENMSDEQPSADHSRATGAFPVANATAPGGSQHRIREDLPDDEGYDPRLSITMLSMGGTK